MPPKYPAPRQYLSSQRHTSLFIWLIAIICAIITIVVIVVGIVVFVGYILIRPKVPSISITYSHLDVFDYDQTGLLTTQLTIIMNWENDNAKAHASFYNAGFVLGFHGTEIAKLVAPPFDVSNNSSLELSYTVKSSSIPLDPEQMVLVDASLKQNLVTFDLHGAARTRWRVGILGSVKFWLHLDCELPFVPSTSNSTGSHCSSKSK